MAKAAFNRKETFQRSTGLKYKEETNYVLHLEHSIVGAETWTLRNVDHKCLGSYEMSCWRRIEIRRIDRVRKEEVLTTLESKCRGIYYMQ